MYRIPELLAPVGGPRQLRAAVENGADAVYMGGRMFNARMNADNFTEESMKEAVEYAHMRGVAIHVTMNTLLRDDELPAAVAQAAELYELGADAFIIQDLGFAALLRSHFPELTLHLSTQGTIYNLEGVRQAEALGFSRVVMARELTLDEIRAVTAGTNMEIEVFVHGALCMCYSGQCQMSRVIGGRSGNRGECAQPCRLSYEIYRDEGELRRMGDGYLLSPKDICTIDHLGELSRAGVASLKIEGRMKSPEYVAVVTGIYRKYLDEYRRCGEYRVSEADRLALNQIFNRGSFTSGYLTGNPGKELLSGDLPKHQGVRIGRVISYNPKRRTAKVSLHPPMAEEGAVADDRILSIGDGVEIRSSELAGNVITYIKGNEIGYLTGGIAPGDAIYKITDKSLMERARASYEGKSGTEQKNLRKRDISMELYARPGEKVTLTVRDGGAGAGKSGPAAEVCSGEPAEPALNRPLDKETVEKQLEKTGGTPFRLAELKLDLGTEPVSVRLSVLNEMRRSALQSLKERIDDESRAGRRIEKARIAAAVKAAAAAAATAPESAQPAQTELITEIGAIPQRAGQSTARISGRTSGLTARPVRKVGRIPKISYYLFEADAEMLGLARDAVREIPGCGSLPVGRYYLPYELFLEEESAEALEGLRAAGKETIPFLPAVSRGREDVFLREKHEELLDLARRFGISAGNPGHVLMFAEAGAKVYGDFALNLCNGADLQLAARLGLAGCVLSNETLSDRAFRFEGAAAAAKAGGLELEAAAGGWIPLMISAHCPVGDVGAGCRRCRGKSEQPGICETGRYYLKDRKSQLYSILTRKRDCQVLIFRDKYIIDREYIGEIAELGLVNLRFYGIDKKIFCG